MVHEKASTPVKKIGTTLIKNVVLVLENPFLEELRLSWKN